MNPDFIPWIILFLPLAAAAVITLFTLHDRKLSAGLSVGAVVAGFLLSLVYVKLNGWAPAHESSAVWLTLGDLQIDFGLRFDPLSLLMLLIVTGVASAIHIYSWGYMSEDRELPALFRLLEPVHLLDARHRAREQFPATLHVLGAGRGVELPAHRFLV